MEDLLNSDTPVLGSIAHKGKRFIRQVKVGRDVDIIEITPPNRNLLRGVLIEKVMHLVVRYTM